jgi:hypothetical protein
LALAFGCAGDQKDPLARLCVLRRGQLFFPVRELRLYVLVYIVPNTIVIEVRAKKIILVATDV